MAPPQGFERGPAHVAGPLSVEEVAERAARLGITVEAVLEQYRRIAFTSLHDIVEWADDGMKLKPNADTAAVIEIVTAAKGGRPYRIKLHDKKIALDALAKAIGVTQQKRAGAGEDEQMDDTEAREFLIQELDRLAAEAVSTLGSLEDPA